MLTKRALKAIALAKDELVRNPYDEGHDISHHNLVYQNCLNIIAFEKIEDVDLEALLVAAMWHDWQRPNNQEEAQKFKSDLKNIFVENDVDEDFLNRVWVVISHHSFGEEQQSIEQKILYDADKLEYVNIDRFIGIILLSRQGKFSIEKVEKYKNAFALRIPIVKNSFYFDYSKNIFAQRIKVFYQLLQSGEYPEIASLTDILHSLI